VLFIRISCSSRLATQDFEQGISPRQDTFFTQDFYLWFGEGSRIMSKEELDNLVKINQLKDPPAGE